MERVLQSKEEARKYLRIADHMLNITYPLVTDPKLLLAVLENLFLSFSKSIGALLYFERLYKRIPPFHDNFESKFNMFKLSVAGKYGFSKEYMRIIEEIKSTIVEHKKSPVEFARKDMFVICSNDYRMKMLSVKEMKDYISKAKLFIAEISNIIEKNERIAR